MAIVFLSHALAEQTGGVGRIVVDAPRVRELVTALTTRHPGLAGLIDHMAVAIDGEIYNDADFRPLRADSEVHFVPRIAGG